MKRFDRWNQMIPTLPHLGKTFEADYQRMATVLEGSPGEVGSILRLFDGYRTMRQVIDHSPIDDITTLRVIRKLLDEALLRDVTPKEADLRETAQHTNLASWLSGTSIRSATKEEASRLFDTSPGVRSVPSLNGEDSDPTTPEEIEEVARSFEELTIAPEPSDDLEEGQAPDLSAQKLSQWRFHWDKDSGQAVAAPTAELPKKADPFALEDLDRDLAQIEARRREEEARRLEADRQRLEEASHAIRATQPDLPQVPAAAAPKKQEEEVYVKKDSTQELHRQSILEAVDDRGRTPTPHALPLQSGRDEDRTSARDPKEGIEDMIAQAERQRAVDEAQDISATVGQQVRHVAESLSDRVSSDFESSTPGTTRTGTDEFDPVVRELLPEKKSPQEIDTLELPRQETAPTNPTNPTIPPVLRPLGSEVSEEPVALAAGPEALQGQDAEEDGAQKSAEREVVAHRTAHNKELVQAEYDLQKGTPLSDKEVAKINEPNQDAKAQDAAHAKAARRQLGDEVEDSDEHEAPVLITPVSSPLPPDDDPKVSGAPAPPTPLGPRDEDEVYATEVPLFADEPKEGFSLMGLVAVAAVVLAVLFVFVFINKEDPEPVAPQEDPVAIADPVQEPLTQATALAALPATPEPVPQDLTDAGSQAGDAGLVLDDGMTAALAALGEEDAPQVAEAQAESVVRTVSFAMITALGKEAQGVEDPVAFLAELPAQELEAAPAAPGDVLAEVETMLLREQLGRARTQLEPLLRAQPNDGRIAGLYGRSMVYSNASQAIDHMTRALGVGYKTPELYIDLGTAYYMRKDKAKARETYRTFLNLYPDHKRAKEVRSILKNQ